MIIKVFVTFRESFKSARLLYEDSKPEKVKKAVETGQKSPTQARVDAGKEIAQDLDKKAKTAEQQKENADQKANERAQSAAAEAAEAVSTPEASKEVKEAASAAASGDTDEAKQKAVEAAKATGNQEAMREAQKLNQGNKTAEGIGKFITMIIEFFKKIFSAFGKATGSATEKENSESNQDYSFEKKGSVRPLGKGSRIHDSWIEDKLSTQYYEGEPLDGVDIVKYLYAICKVEPFDGLVHPAIVKVMIMKESGWKAGAKYAGKYNSDATGLGQFIGSTHKAMVKMGAEGYQSNKNLINDPRWKSAAMSRTNPYFAIYETVLYAYQHAKKGGNQFKSMSIEDQGFFLYAAHHDGGVSQARARIKVRDYFRGRGITDGKDMLAIYRSDASTRETVRNMMTKRQKARIDRRLKAGKAGDATYFKVMNIATTVGRRAALDI